MARPNRRRASRNISKQHFLLKKRRITAHDLMATQNILVVEDDRETRTLIARYLRANGCNPIAVADGREMVRMMAVCRVDVLILDLMLPGEDGLSLCRKVRAESSSLPIIILPHAATTSIVSLASITARMTTSQSRSIHASCWQE
jgi:CheY-like chemotaxis protein